MTGANNSTYCCAQHHQIWSLVCGLSSVVCRLWSVVCGLWSAFCGLWSLFLVFVFVFVVIKGGLCSSDLLRLNILSFSIGTHLSLSAQERCATWFDVNLASLASMAESFVLTLRCYGDFPCCESFVRALPFSTVFSTCLCAWSLFFDQIRLYMVSVSIG